MTQPAATNLRTLRAAPTGHCPKIRPARRYLNATHASVMSLLDTFELLRTTATGTRGTTRGRLSRDQVDVLRASIVFAAAGLDAVCQRLVNDTLEELIGKGDTLDSTAEQRLEGFIRGELHKPTKPTKELVDAIASSDPRAELIRIYRESKTKASYQGSGDLNDRVAKLLGIPASAVPESRFTALDPFFAARNDIVHDLDYEDINGTSARRHHRARALDWTVAQCDLALALAADLIDATADLLR